MRYWPGHFFYYMSLSQAVRIGVWVAENTIPSMGAVGVPKNISGSLAY